MSRDCKFDDFPNAAKFRVWKMSFIKKVVMLTGRRSQTLQWLRDIEELSHEELEDPGPFESLDTFISSAISDMLHGELKRKILIMEELCMESKVLSGRQLMKFVYSNFRATDVDGTLLDFEDLQ